MSVEIPIPQRWKLTKTWCFTLGKKQFSCEQCGNTFTQKWILHHHTRTLTREKPYTCPCHPCSERGYCMTGWNWIHLLGLRVWNQDNTIIHWTLNHVTRVFWCLSHFVGTETRFYTVELAVPSLDKNYPILNCKIVMNFRLWNQDKNQMIKVILTFCGPLLVYCCFVVLFSSNKTLINQ